MLKYSPLLKWIGSCVSAALEIGTHSNSKTRPSLNLWSFTVPHIFIILCFSLSAVISLPLSVCLHSTAFLTQITHHHRISTIFLLLFFFLYTPHATYALCVHYTVQDKMETLQFSVCPVPRITIFSLDCLVNVSRKSRMMIYVMLNDFCYSNIWYLILFNIFLLMYTIK